jgi:hypothetical protein
MSASDSRARRRIERLAYSYWEQRGRPHGSPEVDWFRALELVRALEVVAEDANAFATLVSARLGSSWLQHRGFATTD